jgi:hypothetical protein
MAFQLNKELSTGVTANYWRLAFVEVDCSDDPSLRIHLCLYLNRQARLNGKEALNRIIIEVPLSDIDSKYSYDFRACIYNYLKQRPEYIEAIDILEEGGA